MPPESPGCDHCYALTMAKRLRAMGSAKYQTDGHPRTSGPGFGLALHPQALTEPLRWRRPRRVFVNSMSDVGHARVPREFLAEIFAVMATAHQHTFQILTKRPGRLAKIPRIWNRRLRPAHRVTAPLRLLSPQPANGLGALSFRTTCPQCATGHGVRRPLQVVGEFCEIVQHGGAVFLGEALFVDMSCPLAFRNDDVAVRDCDR